MWQIYLDTSVYNRPFDDQGQPRIWLETLAFSVILQMIEEQRIALVTSSVIRYENSRNPFPDRQRWVNQVIALASTSQRVDTSIRHRAVTLESMGVKALDALHMACAEAVGVDWFVTCDDRLRRRYQSLSSASLRICEPTELVRLLSTEDQEEA